MKNVSASICGTQSSNEKIDKQTSDHTCRNTSSWLTILFQVPRIKIVKHISDIGELDVGQSMEIQPIKIYFLTKTKDRGHTRNIEYNIHPAAEMRKQGKVSGFNCGSNLHPSKISIHPKNIKNPDSLISLF